MIAPSAGTAPAGKAPRRAESIGSAGTATPMVEARGLRKAYGSKIAVDGLSFSISRGETFGLLGPNGAGKSTTMAMLVGALRTDAGEIRIAGDADPTRLGVRQKIGFAPQALSLYDDLSGAENATFFARLYGLRAKALARAVDQALGFCGLRERARDRTKTYSGGMKRRLNLACAIVHSPELLLLDEPTVGVDPQSRNHLFENVEALAEAGCTVIYTTHYMEEAERLCARVAIVDHGRLLALDTVDALIAAHGGHPRVIAELSSAPPNPAALPGSYDGHRLEIETDAPLETVAELRQHSLAIRHLRVEHPTLESVFLRLTGRRLRD